MPEISAITELRRDITEYSFYIEIAGLPYRWYSRTVPPADGYHTDFLGLASVSESKQSIDPLGGVEEAGTLTISITRDVSGEGTDAASILGRLSWDGADYIATLLESLPQNAVTGHVPPYGVTPEVWVNENITGWPTPGTFHLGQEHFYFTGTAGTGVPGDPWRFTGVTRGYLNTLPDFHVVDTVYNWRGVLSSPMVTWEGRQITVYWQARPGAWVQYFDGVLDKPPSISDINIQIVAVSWVAKLDMDISSSVQSTTLLQGYAVIDSLAARRLMHAQYWGEGDVVRGNAQAASLSSVALSGSGTVKVYTPGVTSRHEAVFDLTRADLALRGRLHALHETGGEVLDVIGYGPAMGQFILDLPQPLVELPKDSLLVNVPTGQGHWVDLHDILDPAYDAAIGACVYVWPQAVLNKINAKWGPHTNKLAPGIEPMWADVSIKETDDGWIIEALGNHLVAAGNAVELTGPTLIFTTRRRIERRGLGPFGGGLTIIETERFGAAEHLTYAIDFHVPESIVPSSPTWGNARGGQYFGWENIVKVEASRTTGGTPHQIPIRGVAKAWYQRGQRYLLATNNIFQANQTSVMAEYDDPITEQRASTTFRLSAAVAYTHPIHGAIGTLCTLQDRMLPHSFGDWAKSKNPVLLYAATQWIRVSPSRVLLDLLLSTRGNLVNHAVYDSKPFGLAIPADAVDIPSFGRATIAPAAQPWTLVLRPGLEGKYRDLLNDLLKVSGVALTTIMDRSAGTLKLGLISVGGDVGLLGAADAVADFVLQDPPHTVIDRRVVNSIKLTGVGERDVLIESRDDLSSAGSHAQTLSLNMLGLGLATADRSSMIEATRDIWTRIFDHSGQPRRLIECTIDLAEAVTIHPGSIVTITYAGPGMVNLDGTIGFSARPCRVLEIEKSPSERVARLLLEPGNRNVTGWAPAMRVQTVVNPTTVEVQNNYYTESTSPETGLTQRDSNFFAVNDVCRMYPIGNWSGTTRTITSLDDSAEPHTIIFNGAHGLVAGDDIEAPPYASATAAQRVYAYLAGSDNLIDTAPGQVWR